MNFKIQTHYMCFGNQIKIIPIKLSNFKLQVVYKILLKYNFYISN